MIFTEILLMENVKDPGEKICEAIRKAVEFAVLNEGIEDAELSVAIADDEIIRALNREFREKDAATDVLSFPANDVVKPLKDMIDEGFEPEIGEGGAPFLGDIVISLDTATRQAEEYENTLEEEICFLAVHGTLHLLGYDHIEPEDETIMREKQREARRHRLEEV